MARISVQLCSAIAGTAWASQAIAGPPPSAPDSTREAKAEARFREASAAFDAGRLDAACAAFDASLHLFPTLGTLLNLALCHEKQGKTASAWLEFTYAAAWASDSAQRDRGEFAHQHALRLERGLLRVEIELPSEAHAHLEIDGQPVADSRQAFPVFLDPGTHVIAATAPGGERYESTVTVAAGASSGPLVVTIPALKDDASHASAQGRRGERSQVSGSAERTPAWILGGVGLVSLSVAAYFGGDSLSKMGSLESSCKRGCDAGPAKASETISLVTLGVGVAALASGVWLVLSPSSSATSATGRFYAGAHAVAQGVGVAVGGAW
jgi:hypothetical protein